MGPKRWSKIVSISPGWGSISKLFCRLGIYSQSQVKKSGAWKQFWICFGLFFLHPEKCQKGFQSSERLFQNLDEQNKGLTLRTSAIIYFRGNMSNKKDSMLTKSLTKKASMWGASCETRKGFALRTVVTKGIHFGGIVSNKKGSMLTTSLTWKALVLGASGFNKK